MLPDDVAVVVTVIADMIRSDVVVMGLGLVVLGALVGVGSLATRSPECPRCAAAEDAAPADRGRLPPPETDRPIIGVLSLELSGAIQKVVGKHHSYIAASYVKFIEGAGARVAPILIGQSPEYYRQKVNSVNGLLLPGGATYFDEKSGYFAAGKELYRLAVAANKAGSHLPVLGICLGMELLLVAAAGTDFRQECVSEDPLPLHFLAGSKRDSRLFARAPQNVIDVLEKQNVTANHHSKCFTRQHMQEYGPRRQPLSYRSTQNERRLGDWRTLTVSNDANGLEFVSTYEHERLPIYGLQFHPEKAIYEWKSSKNYPHSSSAIAAARYFADFLVSEARRNSHSFPRDQEREQLIYRHQPTDTEGRLMWEQLYLFAEPRPEQEYDACSDAPGLVEEDHFDV